MSVVRELYTTVAVSAGKVATICVLFLSDSTSFVGHAIGPAEDRALALKRAHSAAAEDSAPRHRCAETGEFVTEGYADAHPATTIKES